MGNQGLQEIRSQPIEVRRLLLAAITAEQRLYQRYTEAEGEAERWRRRAELALARGDEELARAALGRATDCDARAEQHRRQYQEQKQYVEWLKVDLRQPPRAVPPPPLPARPPVGLGEEQARLVAWAELERDELAERLEALEQQDLLERQLAELKRKMGAEQA